jgi:hypothetical protein
MISSQKRVDVRLGSHRCDAMLTTLMRGSTTYADQRCLFPPRSPRARRLVLGRAGLAVALAFCVVLPVSASAKEHRSALVKRKFQLTHPVGDGKHKRRMPRLCSGSHRAARLWRSRYGR